MQEKHPAHAKKFTLELYRAFFRGDRDISKLDVIGDIAAGLGYSADEVIAATQSEDIKNKLKANVEAAIATGIFGSPFFIVDGEQFWGADRLPMMEAWITKGAWKY
jgi:2-hydroxychromene-2-carboxylate isomerase